MRLIKMVHCSKLTMCVFSRLLARQIASLMMFTTLFFWNVSNGDVTSRSEPTEHSWRDLEQFDVLISGYFTAPAENSISLKYLSSSMINVTFKIREIYKAPTILSELVIEFSEHTFFVEHWNKRVAALEHESASSDLKKSNRNNSDQFEKLRVKRQIQGELLDRQLKGSDTLSFNMTYVVGLRRFRSAIVPSYENTDQPREVVVINPALSPGLISFLEKLREGQAIQ